MVSRNHLKKVRRRNARKARNKAKLNKAKKKKKKKSVPQRAPKNPPCSKRKFLRALKGTAGVYKDIAHRLNTSVHQVKKYLDRPGWEDVRKAWREEKDRVLDLAEDAIAQAIESGDPKIATKNARWFLEKRGKERGYGDKVTIEGGENPIRHEVGVVVLDEERLAELSLEERKKILAELDEEEQKQLSDGDDLVTVDAKEKE